MLEDAVARILGGNDFGGGEEFAKGTTFNEKVIFNGIKVHGIANFQGVEFKGDADFIDARFGNDAYFFGATFEGEAVFNRAQITGMASFIPPLGSSGSQLVQGLFGGEGFVVGADAGRYIVRGLLTTQARSMTVNRFAQTLRRRYFSHDFRVFSQNSGEVHHLTEVFYVVAC